MMPCVSKDNKLIGVKEKPKNIYKPKYHAFSIDSLVGNNTSNNAHDKKNVRESVDEKEEEDNISFSSIRRTPPNTQSSNTVHKLLNTNNNRVIVNQNELSKQEKNGILRSYMTTSHYITSHNSNYMNTSNQNINNINHNHNVDPRFDTIMRSNINNNSNSINHNESDLTGVSPFNNQYYCNQMYCRPYDERFLPNAFTPQVCDYKSMLTKSSDICCQSSFSPYRKPKRIRTAFSPGQLLRLEEIFERNRYVVGCERKQLARDLNLSETQIKVWFQNRRTKHKREKHQENKLKKTSSASLTGSTSMTGNCSDNEVDFEQNFSE